MPVKCVDVRAMGYMRCVFYIAYEYVLCARTSMCTSYTWFGHSFRWRVKPIPVPEPCTSHTFQSHSYAIIVLQLTILLLLSWYEIISLFADWPTLSLAVGCLEPRILECLEYHLIFLLKSSLFFSSFFLFTDFP